MLPPMPVPVLPTVPVPVLPPMPVPMLPPMPVHVLPPGPVPVLPPDPVPVEVETFDEDDLMEKLSKLKSTKSSIDSVVNLCTSFAPAYKVVRCLDKQLRKVPADQKLTLFYVFHELALETKKKVFFNRRLGKLILSILPNIINILPQSRVMKCIGIWQKYFIFSKKIVQVLEKIVSDSQSLNASSSSKKSCNQSCFTFASHVRKTVDERLDEDFPIY